MQRKRNIHQKLCLTLILTSATFFHNSDFFVFIFHFRLASLHNTYCILIFFIQFGFYIFFCMNIILIFNFLFSLCLPTTQTMGFIICRIFVFALATNFNLILIFLSQSGDLGIGLVWDNHPLTHPPLPPHFSLWLLKSSSNWTKLSMIGPQLFSGWYQMILDVFRCSQLFSDVFSWVVTFMDSHPLCGHFFSGSCQMF